MIQPDISVVISTYNRCEYLQEAIDSVLIQDLPEGSFEVIVVDNNSTDHTENIVQKICKTHHGSCLRYIKEKKQGLSFARNSGAGEAAGRIIAFLDDDAVCRPGWLKALTAVYRKYPQTGVAGGRILPVWMGEKPQWLSQNLEMAFGVLDFGNEIKELFFPQTPFGGNFSVDRDVFIEIGGFSAELGRNKHRLLASEEVFLCSQVQDRAGKILYTPEAVVWHKVLKERLNKAYLFRRAFSQGRSNILMERMRKNSSPSTSCDSFRNMAESARGFIKHMVTGQHKVLTEDLFFIFFSYGKLFQGLLSRS